tara:strand:- start:623 stop:2872 length:2250 start_codon:yes stop_codon:yes gene_type:complete
MYEKDSKHIINWNSSLKSALQRIEDNNSRLVFICNENNQLLGCLSDTDIRKYLIKESSINLESKVNQIMNKKVKYITEGQIINKSYLEKYKLVPIVNKTNQVIRVINNRSTGTLKIGDKLISKESKCFIIAEIGNNHNGSIKIAKKLILESIKAGADAVKFQLRDMDKLYFKRKLNFNKYDLSVQYTLDLLKKVSLNFDQLSELFDFVKENGSIPLCTAWESSSLNNLEKYGLEAYKVASADLTNIPFIEDLISTNKPLILSTGMSTEKEINTTVDLLQSRYASFALLHCNSTYPAPLKDINLNYIKHLKREFAIPVGYSGHEKGIQIPIAAVALGAQIIEKHITLDQNMEGTDHKASITPEEFKFMTASIREIEQALGSSGSRKLTQGEMINRENLGKSIIAKETIQKGTIIKENMITFSSPGSGLNPSFTKKILGKKAIRDFSPGEMFYESDISSERVTIRNFSFSKKYGIPVRFHDFKRLIKMANLDFIEFHLSYSDLTYKFIKEMEIESVPKEFSVHCPELFENDHILDLCSFDKFYREKSKNYLHVVCNTVEKIRENIFHHCNSRIPLIINVGGWNKNGFISNQEKKDKYKICSNELGIFAKEYPNINFLIQTMPPYPWHLGGRSHHNLFVKPEEISEFCKENNFSICLDTSHAIMASNYLDITLNKYINELIDFIDYLHIADSKGIDGEGFQIGEGDLNIQELALSLSKLGKEVLFIPEIWQGHKDNGREFWKALDLIQRINF